MGERGDAAWVRRRMPAWEAGLLNEEEEERLLSLVHDDAECRRIFQIHQATGPVSEDAVDHISPYILARWNRARAELREGERRLIREHLESCESCRAELAMLGHRPVLAGDTAGESPAARERPPHRPPPRRRLRDFFAGTPSAGLAWAAAAAMLVVVLARGPRDEPGLVLRVGDPVLAMTTRSGGEGRAFRVYLTRDRRHLPVTLSLPPTLPPDQVVVVKLVSPEGTEVLERATTAGEVADRVLVLRSADRLQPGRYALRLQFPSGPESREVPLDVLDESAAR